MHFIKHIGYIYCDMRGDVKRKKIWTDDLVYFAYIDVNQTKTKVKKSAI